MADSNTPYFSSAKEMLAAGIETDVVSICSPNGLHAEHSLLALEHGKHIVCEKPMALSKADCESIIYKALQMHKNVFCVMQNRYSPPSVWIKEVVEKKLLGNIFMVQLNCYWNRDDRYYKKGSWKGSQSLDGGTLYTQFSHFIDIMYWLFGDIKDIQAKFNDFTHAQSTEFEDSGVVSFQFVNGGMCCINYSTAVWDTNLESSITIIGEKGSIKIGGQYMNQVEYCHIKDYTKPDVREASPGLQVVEATEWNRQRAMCCGGGGGNVWNEGWGDKGVNVIRLEQLRKPEPTTLAVACPFCMVMFEDAAKNTGVDETLQRRDVAELLLQSLGEK